MSALPYRANVGAALFSRDGLVFVGRRADLRTDAGDVWQMPQGGIDADEDPRTAVLRELHEEIGTDRAEIVGEHPEWLSYDLPAHLVGQALGGKYRGQRQRWFALRFLGTDDEIKLDLHHPIEFDAWKWVSLDELLSLNVGFKTDVYRTLVSSFGRFALST